MAIKLPKTLGVKKEGIGKLPGRLPTMMARQKLLKASSAPCFVLLIGDEGAILIYIKDGKVQSRQFFADAGPHNLEEMRERLSADAQVPLLMVIDNMDQTYVQQTLPPVSSLSVQKLMKRRLDRDFSGTDLKGAIILGREALGRKDWNFMIVALDKTPQLSLWIDFVTELPNRLQGIYAVPVEAEMIVRDIERGMGLPEEGKEPPQWKFLVSHNKAGGFRQIILKNGRLIFTRLAQPIGESTPEVIAGNIEQEMLSTIEYMKRLGFNAQDGLDIFIIASSAIKPLIDSSKFKSASLHIITPHEAANFSGIEGATQPTDQFGDVFLAASIGMSKKHVLRLTMPKFIRLDRLYQMRLLQRVLAAVACLGAFLYAGNFAYTMYTVYTKNDELQATKVLREKSLEMLRAEIKQSDIDVEKAGDMIELYQQMLQETLSPVPAIARLKSTLKPSVVVKSLDWSLDSSSAPAGSLPSGNKMTFLFTLEFPHESVDAFRDTLKKTMADLKAAFKDCDVVYTKVPPGFSENERMDLTFEDKGKEKKDQAPWDAEVSIKGKAILAALPAEALEKAKP